MQVIQEPEGPSAVGEFRAAGDQESGQTSTPLPAARLAMRAVAWSDMPRATSAEAGSTEAVVAVVLMTSAATAGTVTIIGAGGAVLRGLDC
jgi:hypothetical protein